MKHGRATGGPLFSGPFQQAHPSRLPLRSLSFTCPVRLWDCAAALPSLLVVCVWRNTREAYTQTQRNATPCDLSPTTTRGTASDEGAKGGSCSHVPALGRRKHSNWNPENAGASYINKNAQCVTLFLNNMTVCWYLRLLFLCVQKQCISDILQKA